MLSNPTNNLQNRQRQHRRQQSTPTAFEAVKVTTLPHIQRQSSHRRGMSLDQRRRQTSPQGINTVSSTNNQGYQTTQQHILRETQQQRLARPGQQYTTFDNDENYLMSPLVNNHRESFDAGCTNEFTEGNLSPYSYTGTINTISEMEPSRFNEGQDFNLFSTDATLTPSEFIDFSAGFNDSMDSHSGQDSRRSSLGKRISGGIVDRVTQFENLTSKSPQRPLTPPNQNSQAYFPLTPAETPYNRASKHEPTQQSFHDSWDTSMEETIKPKNNQPTRGVFDDMRKQSEQTGLPSPPRTGKKPSRTNDSAPMPKGNFMNVSRVNSEFVKQEKLDNQQYSPASAGVSPALPYLSSPEVTQMNFYGDQFANQTRLEARHMSYPEPPEPSNHDLPSIHSPDFGGHDDLSAGHSPASTSAMRRRSESVSSINVDETVTETGITIDDIATFITGPDPNDGKWDCLYPACNKRFGRKENIKSHVQTHLGDRQFQCPYCSKCFVRQHDLKRHAKIHSGVKPYPCQCGNSFARHDALTRHRQRGMCIGAFEGVVKKTVKRGRPRKNRPDNEERMTKSSRTRNKNKAMSSTSSTTGSESTSGSSPRSDLDDILDDKPFAEYENVRFSHNTAVSDVSNFNYEEASSPLANDCVSPHAIQANSPSALSTHSAYTSHHGSITSDHEHHLQSHPPSPAKSVHSVHSQYHSLQYHSPGHSPPGLCDSSSPAASIYYDMETTSDHDGLTISGLGNVSEHDDEMFLDAFATAESNDMTQLERDPNLLLGKFEDAYGSNGITGDEDLFRGGEDVFFGSP